MTTTPAFAFGDDMWPGLAKLTEECGEVLQVVGKLLMTHGDPAHWSGNLRTMLLEEVADVEAAISFFTWHNLSPDEAAAHSRRVEEKITKFNDWHRNMDADPPPALIAPTNA
jgi:NTP pyrophosphatase (non-canonical NTP hydrolase)